MDNECSTNLSESSAPEQQTNGIQLDAILDGCLGFGLSAGTLAYLFFSSIQIPFQDLLGASFAAIAALIVALLLFLFHALTDRIQTIAGRRVINVLFVAGAILAYLGSSVTLVPLVIIGASVGIVSGVMIYGRFLCSLPRQSLMVIIDVLFVYTGAIFLILKSVNTLTANIVIGVVVLASIVFTGAFMVREHERQTVFSAQESKEREVKLKGDHHTLFIIGFMFSGALLAVSLDVDSHLIVITVGVAVMLSGVFSTLMRSFDEKEYKRILLRSMGVVSVVLLLPVALVPDNVGLVFLGVYTFVVSLNVIVLFNAVIESARFDMISPVWILGKQGSMFFVGIAVGSALFGIGGYFSAQVSWLIGCVCIVAAALCSLFQISCNYQVYPYEGSDDDIDEEVEIAEQLETRTHEGIWKRKYKEACRQYKLSPRECEVLHILLRGRDTKYIMDEFTISQSTAKTHIYNIYRKFDVHSRQDLLDVVESISLDDAEEGDDDALDKG